MRRPRFFTLRDRLTLLAVIVAAIAIGSLTVAFNLLLNSSLDRDVKNALRTHAGEHKSRSGASRERSPGLLTQYERSLDQAFADFDNPGLEGRRLFAAAGCQSCHGGEDWTNSILDFRPPAAAAEVVDAQLSEFLCRVGTFDPALFADGLSNEIRANNVANVQARGAIGFNVPSLISVFASAPYQHSGAAPTLDAVLQNVTHRSAGTAGVDTLRNPEDRKELVRFLQSIDRTTTPFPSGRLPSGVCGP